MNRKRMCLPALVLLAALLFAAWGVAEAEEDAPAEWTVMYYLCGSDLESCHGYATGNLEEIAKCCTYEVLRHIMRGGDEEVEMPGGVNVVLQTGGCREWHAQALGMTVDPSALQRWVYRPTPRNRLEEDGAFDLTDTQPLASMADPQTLSGFIRWAAERYPAKKYALVLWDHGGGGKTGLFVDELFNGDTMQMDALKQAMADGGVTFEAVLFDACLMANLETASAIMDSARWMIASEEVVAGKGTAIGNWLQQLYVTPQWDGERLGRWICDMTQIRYANEADGQAQSLLTWSVIDLSQIDRVVSAFDRLFEACGRVYVDNCAAMQAYTWFFRNSEEYGLGDNNMYDLSGFFYNDMIAGKLPLDLYCEAVDALTDAVRYSVRGSGRGAARGLSFCFATDFNVAELDAYAHNCPSPHYLALLDAINPEWTAPDWVYETVEPLPDIRELSYYNIGVTKSVSSDGIPGVVVETGWANIDNIFANLYRKNADSGQNAQLGIMVADMGGDSVNVLDQFWLWPAVEGVYCDTEIVRVSSDGMKMLINIPVRISGENSLLRCVYSDEDKTYTIVGVWEGFDADSKVFHRNVISLAQMAGQEFSLLYPIDGTGVSGKTLYEASPPMTLYRALEISEAPLPEGDYILEYWVMDMFMRHLPIGRVEVHWDGKALSLPDEAAWTGRVDLSVPEA